ncbi:hypothetical protein BDV24DRAFT_142672 [Aspergillus arachidicola]|uniref:Uncharacterized protein n=1 Tax=Aspergillus arachidicola TaxID=656916 RepID=A0A5N6XS05_9EURO|nr:hypothetical protein BDV24DRAFT_142672 [Aspergillus arachidicola]
MEFHAGSDTMYACYWSHHMSQKHGLLEEGTSAEGVQPDQLEKRTKLALALSIAI